MTRESDEVVAARAALGEHLTRHRESNGLTQRQLADRTHYHRTSISKLEAGSQPAPREFWCAADELLGAAGQLVTAFDELATLKATMERKGSADALAAGLTATMVPVARTARRVRSTSATPEQVDIATEFQALSRMLTEHTRLMLMGEYVDWTEIAERLRAAAASCERQVIIDCFPADRTTTTTFRPR